MQIKKMVILAASGGVPRRSFWVAVVVGTLLNLINQGDAMATGQSISWLKFTLTYLVPFAVNTYGSVSARIHFKI
ncbi:MAG: nitrate/nitrite transporter NrtS [Paracoccaceae bacterium]|nr:nitrate/nitrite transporter NrtS [Paracoccaceae bacterium]